jgi:diacylglycerol kinase (ATP)
VGGVGLDSEVARRANGLPRWLRGHGGYVVSLPPALFRFVALPMKISVASGANTFAPHSEKPTVLAAFANAPTYGGGMKIAPHAQMDDGKLDVCVISDIDKFKLFYLFPSVYFGKHLGMEEVEYLQTERLKIETEKPLAVYADGEYVCETPVEIRIAPAALPVIVQSSLTGF